MKLYCSLFILTCLLLAMNSSAEETENKTQDTKIWQFISEAEMPPNSIVESDAFLTKYIRYRGINELNEKYIVMEGWENGWHYYIWNNEKWDSITNVNEAYYSDFEIGYFNADDHLDIVLHNALQEENFSPHELPPMPRLFLGDGQTFMLSSPICSRALHGVFSSKLEIYKQKYAAEPPPDFLVPYITTEEKNLSGVCKFKA